MLLFMSTPRVPYLFNRNNNSFCRNQRLRSRKNQQERKSCNLSTQAVVMTTTVSTQGADVWNKLLAANKSYAADSALPPRSSISIEMRESLMAGQAPPACVISCSDSRVPPELIFGAGLGELFVIRTAGTSIADIGVLGSVEYAIANLGCQLIVVLGHLNCGAVKAAIDVEEDTTGEVAASLGPNLKNLIVDEVGLVVRRVRESGGGGGKGEEGREMVKACMRERVRELRAKSDIVKRAMDEGEVTVMPAFYDFKTGLVTKVS